MLILNRRIDQGIRIFDADGRYMAHVMVLGIERDRVKLGIDADPRFLVIRDELLTPEQSVSVRRMGGAA